MTLTGTPVRDALDTALVALQAAGVPDPRLDAEVLLAHALKIDRARLLTDRNIVVAGEPGRRFRDDIRLRNLQCIQHARDILGLILLLEAARCGR